MSFTNADNIQKRQQHALHKIHAGVRVKVRSQRSTYLPLDEYHENKDHNKIIGIQTATVISKFDEQLLCNLANSNDNNRQYRSTSSSSETSVSNKYSTRSDDTSASDHRPNQNNNAKNIDAHRVQDMLSSKKPVTNDNSLNNHDQSQQFMLSSAVLTGRKKLFNYLLDFVSSLRLTSSKHDSVYNTIGNNRQNEETKPVQTLRSRCQRSAVQSSTPNHFSKQAISNQSSPIEKANSPNKMQRHKETHSSQRHDQSFSSSIPTEDCFSKNALSCMPFMADSILCQQTSVSNKFLPRKKDLHINNHALDNDSNVNISTEKQNLQSKATRRTSVASVDNQSVSTDNSSKDTHRFVRGQNEIVRESIHQLIRYQKFAKSYRLESNKAIQDFLMKSTVLTTQSLYSLSIKNEPYHIRRLK
ncbi:unnamed protein product [Adineta ricciae]|uniref:Uncharacterized protein n=1 Tax=Adineta ricciae TaxID=249248 RepID=A0A813PHZ0_ADIRI|nr:unnamed protein product [Adineta ricciae]